MNYKKQSNVKECPLPYPYRLLVIGQLNYGSTSCSRLKALSQIFDNIAYFNITPFIENLSLRKHILTNHFYCGTSLNDINNMILKKAGEFHPEILWVDKCLYLWPESLEIIRKNGCSLFICFSPDNQMILTNQSRHYLKSIPIYDIHVTTKKHNLDWLIKCGANRIEHIGNGFDPDVHKPINLTLEELSIFGCDIGFVGHWEPSREEILIWLWRQGYKLKVWGGNWIRARRHNHPLFVNSRHLIGDDYARAICGAKINFCLLSKWHMDMTTDRSIEIPACGQFMLAERNEEHLTLFEEGVEAEFYNTHREMVKKIDYYLNNENKRKLIGGAGRQRCLSGYSNEVRLRELLGKIIL